MSMRNQDFTSAGWNMIDRSLMRSSRSESKNSRTRFRLFFEGYISINLRNIRETCLKYYLCDILMMQFLHVFDFTDGGHVHS